MILVAMIKHSIFYYPTPKDISNKQQQQQKWPKILIYHACLILLVFFFSSKFNWNKSIVYKRKCILDSAKNRGLGMGELDTLAHLHMIENTWDTVIDETEEREPVSNPNKHIQIQGRCSWRSSRFIVWCTGRGEM